MDKLTFFDFFSGIGGFRLGFEKAGHECVGHCDIDKYANQAYSAIFDIKEHEKFYEDIRIIKGNELPKADLWCGGFPCQDISVAGKQKGLQGERSGLFFEVIRLLKETEHKPTYLILENVRNIFSVNNGKDFGALLLALDEVGYDAEWQLVNSCNFGVPQNRERVYIIGYLRDRSCGKVLPINGANSKVTIKNLSTRRCQGYECYDINGINGTLTVRDAGHSKKVLIKLNNGKSQGMRVYDSNGISCTLSSNGGGFGTKTGLYKVRNGDIYRVRKLTPKECFRLQGFPDWAFECAKNTGLSDTQLYKLAGNAVTVNVVYEIAKKLSLNS